ncbi:hypothetical protein TIFTF001_025251 [Ficus carica]|uniref:DUF8040 domain-containing protein n=1 Tax=Ficus carica TaxID=3494 RepID=A0AA88DE03_FICCA|nr:hypothetical protein TIFTF001_025251 [Ficus carica]
MNESDSASEREKDGQNSENDERDNDDVITMAVVAVVASRRNRRRPPQPMHNSRLTDTFRALSDALGCRKLLRPTRYMNVHKQLFIFLSICAQGAMNRHILYLFQHSRETTSQTFYKVLTVICALKDEFIKSPNYTEVGDPILDEYLTDGVPVGEHVDVNADVEMLDSADDAGPSIGSQQDASTQGAMNRRRKILADEMWDIYQRSP